ncbi:MAG: hypothetical protein IPL79_15875 [Myxococcales bacterium]|nr:hypothetical protein [Myxococcales bacterium]
MIKQTLGLTWLAAVATLAVGCAGSTVDGPPASPPPTPVPPQVTVAVTGTVIELFDETPVAAAGVATAGTDPGSETTTDDEGEFAITVPVTSVIYATATKAGFATTSSGPYKLGETATDISVPVVNAATLTQIKTAAVPEGNLEHGVVIVDVQSPAGVPLEGISLGEDTVAIKLDGAPMAEIPRRLLDANLNPLSELESVETDATGRFLLFSVPAGSYTLAVKLGPDAETPPVEASLEVPASGAAILTLKQPGAAIIVDSFADDIYPLLQRTADGGYGCARCHSANSTAGYRIHFDAPAVDVCRWIVEGYTAAEPNPLDPNAALERPPLAHFVEDQEDQSRLLYFPLYGKQFSGPNDPPAMLDTHPNATFVSTSDPGYLTLKQWVTNNVDYTGAELLQMACGITPPS